MGKNNVSISATAPGSVVVNKWEGFRGNPYFYGIQVADVARSYHLARIGGYANFQYNQNMNLFNGNVTDSNGNCLMDCSGLAGLVLRGIDFKHSPFNGASGTPNKTVNPAIISTLCKDSEYVWADDYLDKQTDPILKDIGVSGYRSVRNAAQQAQYYYDKGLVLYEYPKGAPPTSIPSGLCPGDLIFWSKEAGSDEQKSRFMSITHVAIVGRDTTRFYQVTGKPEEKGDTVFYSELAEKLGEITLIVRPNYYPLSTPSCPTNINLLPQHGFDSMAISSEIEKSGVTFKCIYTGGFTTKGEATTGVTFYIYDKDKPVKLTAGTYKLSGVPVHPQVTPGSTSTKWQLVVRGLDGTTYGKDNGAESTFTLDATTEVYVYFYISADLTNTSTFSIKPSLVRTK